MKPIRFTFILLLMFYSIASFAQKRMPGYQHNTEALQAIYERVKKENAERNLRVEEYMNNHPGLKRLQKKDNNILFIHDIKNGKPVYRTSHNAESAENMGIPAVREGGRLGLNLTGSNMKVHIWDAGAARFTHREYEGRLQNGESGQEDNHGSHVAGTILAGGLNLSARGMAYEARGEAYGFNNDTEEILSEVLSEGIIISNHSYGRVLGWNDGRWFGDESISSEEDYLFGFYNSNARLFDEITYNSPYYTVVKSAGNDRNDSGDGTHLPDGPFDIVGDFGVSKNVITIGAIVKLGGTYTQPNDVDVSSFTAFGPVDDGRIKPDFVAPGVSLFSCFSSADDAYGSLSGTSMSAPSATGAFTLINEASVVLNNQLLRAATLKAIAMNTAFEAGPGEGPDYRHGWGLINVEGAVETILREDGVNIQILEETLQNNDTFLLALNPVANEKITVSLAWTDLPGTPPAPQLDPEDLMLVNDLDMRIVDEVGNEEFPWILDPQRPGFRASRGDNFRDNAEKIEFDNPQPRRYFVQITHKGSLETGSQDFSLVVDYTSEDTGTENLYWVNSDGTWQDISRWSENSGGSTNAQTPEANNRLIFDDNSFAGTGGTVTMDQDYEVAAVTALSSKEIVFDLGGNTLTVNGALIIPSSNFTIRNGTIIFENEDAAESFLINLDRTRTDNLNLVIGADNRAIWEINDSQITAASLSLAGGNLNVNNSTLNITSIDLGGDAGTTGFNLQNTVIRNPSTLLINNVNWIDDSLTVIRVDNPDANAVITVNQEALSMNAGLELTAAGQVIINGDASTMSSIDLSTGTLIASTNITVDALLISNAGLLNLDAGLTLTINEDLTVTSDAENIAQIIGLSSAEKSFVDIVRRQKLCFDFMNIEQADLMGAASVSVGMNSTLENAMGWSAVACEDLLFANFEGDVFCAGGLTTFTNTSEGIVDGQTWSIDGEEISRDKIATYSFPEPGFYTVKLEVTDGQGGTSEFEQMIEVLPSSIPAIRLGENSRQLFSFEGGDAFQWYRDGVKLEGETERAIEHENIPGVYFVVVISGGCNRKSEEISLGTTSAENLDVNGSENIRFFPIPARDILNINFLGEIAPEVEIQILNTLGKIVYQRTLPGADLVSVDMSGLNDGLYVCVIKTNDKIFTKKIIKQNSN